MIQIFARLKYLIAKTSAISSLLLSVILVGCTSITGQNAVAAATGLQTPVTTQMLDRATFAVWVDGRESSAGLPAHGPQSVIWTQNSMTDYNGFTFGDSKTLQTRYLRIGFTADVPVGTVLVRGGGQLSVLKPSATYPGQLNNDADWIPAQRLSGTTINSNEVGHEEYVIWTLPFGTHTRALRFAHTPAPIDASFAGWLGGAYVLADRYANIAPATQVVTGSNPGKADLITDGSNNNTWSVWDNMPVNSSGPDIRTDPVSASHPEYVTLIWSSQVKLQGVCALGAGFGEAEVQTFRGNGDPRQASESQWQTIRNFPNIQTLYPLALSTNWLDFGQTITTRAIRMRITKPTVENHEHLRGKTVEGKRIWLAELLALQPLDAAPLTDAILAGPQTPNLHPPIPIRIDLPMPGFVTLVIEDAQGHRIRNLLSATYAPKAGPQTFWWDGMDDLGRDTEAARHGVYATPGQLVAPGAYRVHGLVRPQVDLSYEFSVYNAGHPAWETADHTGAWLANHTPPSSTLFVPGDQAPGGKPLVFIGSYVSEGTDGLAWVDLNGNKQGGRTWVGGAWTGAQCLARDTGPDALANVYAYVGSIWPTDNSNKQYAVRLTGLTPKGDRPILNYVFTPDAKIDASSAIKKPSVSEMGGLAVHNGLLVLSLTGQGQLMIVDATTGKVLGTVPLDTPRGLAFEANGDLLALSDTHLVRFAAATLEAFTANPNSTVLKPQIIVENGLQEPMGITLDRSSNIYISDQGNSHQVKVFASNGRLLRTLGHPGVPHTGTYDREHMNHPKGLTIDERNQLWVAEEDFQPKRVSVWSLDGKLLHDFYGPGQYGGGGKLDPKDKSRFYYYGMEFRLDWQQGSDQLINVFYRTDRGDLQMPERSGLPETPLYVHDTQYMTNAYNSSPTNGTDIAVLWQMRDGLARAVAAIGCANEWSLLKGDAFRSRWPAGVDLQGKRDRNETLFVWCDLNGDGNVQPGEVTMRKAKVGGVTIMPDLAFALRMDDKAMRYTTMQFTPQGVPLYDINQGQVLATGAQARVSTGGDQTLIAPDGWTVLTTAPKPFSPFGLGGVKNGQALWTYPSLWPGLHASHEAPAPDHPGEIIGTTRLLGSTFTPDRGEAGALWAVNGNMGDMYIFTSDGLFVTQLFQDVRQGHTWTMPVGARDMKLNALTLHDENFWPSVTQTASDGKIYLVDGARTSLVRIDGLDQIRRLPPITVSISATDLQHAQDYQIRFEALRQQSFGTSILHVALRSAAPAMNGNLDTWKSVEWASIDKRGVAAYFNSNSKPYDIKGTLIVAKDRLYAGFSTGDPNLLQNTGDMPNALFKTGGALDLMLGTNPGADPKRQKAVEGDIRLLVTLVQGKPRALLYRAVVPGVTAPVAFSSPSRSITIDRVEDVSDQIQFAQDGKGGYEFSIPLETLGWKPQVGQSLQGDIGVLRGNGFETVQRVYWSNKATGITADVPSEAELTPQLWGQWQVTATP